MKPTLQTRLGQQLSLTPQLRQAIRLLQLSAMELEAELNSAIESNPLLEHEDEPEPVYSQDHTGEKPAETEARENGEDTPGGDQFGSDEGVEWFESSAGGYERRGHGEDEPDEMATAAPVDLHGHLIWQLHLSHLGPRDVAIGEALIEAINDDGYLEGPLEDIQAALSPQITADAGEIETVLHIIQHFDPVGAGARNLSIPSPAPRSAPAKPNTSPPTPSPTARAASGRSCWPPAASRAWPSTATTNA
jgi:RNA polymerase sigma-54 factor